MMPRIPLVPSKCLRTRVKQDQTRWGTPAASLPKVRFQGPDIQRIGWRALTAQHCR